MQSPLTIAAYRSRSSGRVFVNGYLTHEGEWIINSAHDVDFRPVAIPDFELDDVRKELSLQAQQDAIDAADEREWLNDCGDTLEAMSDDDVDAFALETEGYLAAAQVSR